MRKSMKQLTNIWGTSIWVNVDLVRTARRMERNINGKEIWVTKLWFGTEDYIDDITQEPGEIFR